MVAVLLRLMLVSSFIFIYGCASQFPNPDNAAFVGGEDALDGKQLFEKTFIAHGGEAIDELNDVNVAISGRWERLIKKIQPLVTDFRFRVDSEERILPKEFTYASLYTGPAGNKKVVKTPEYLRVYYNEVRSTDPEVISSTALTADAFPMFLLGPLALHRWSDKFIRLEDVSDGGKAYYRIYLLREPGFGFSDLDEVVLWLDKESYLTQRVQITLEGHSTTKGAHVEVEYLAFQQKGDYVFPTQFYERVNAPIAIGAHAWEYTGLDVNRGLEFDDLKGARYSEKAQVPAKPL